MQQENYIICKIKMVKIGGEVSGTYQTGTHQGYHILSVSFQEIEGVLYSMTFLMKNKSLHPTARVRTELTPPAHGGWNQLEEYSKLKNNNHTAQAKNRGITKNIQSPKRHGKSPSLCSRSV